jgi:hypothetical protein
VVFFYNFTGLWHTSIHHTGATCLKHEVSIFISFSYRLDSLHFFKIWFLDIVFKSCFKKIGEIFGDQFFKNENHVSLSDDMYSPPLVLKKTNGGK